MRKLLVTMAAFGAIAWAGPAWAVVDVDTVPSTGGGQETAGQTVALVQTDKGPPVSVTGHPAANGHVVFRVPDAVARHAKSVVVVKTGKDKKKEESAVIPWDTFKLGGPIVLLEVGSSGFSQTQTLPFSVSFGATGLFTNTKVGWLGTGTGGGVTTRFSEFDAMPTVGGSWTLWALAPEVRVSVSGNVMFPVSGSWSRNVMSGGFAGTESFRQGTAGDAFVNLTGSPAMGWNIIGGAGVAANHYKASAVFPTAGDNFSGSRTDVVPAFQAGLWGNAWGGVFTVMVVDFLPGRSFIMPGGNAISFGTAKAENTVGVTAKWVVPFGVPLVTPSP